VSECIPTLEFTPAPGRFWGLAWESKASVKALLRRWKKHRSSEISELIPN
jgi:hypothetical protein